jgi:hypothetical protein
MDSLLRSSALPASFFCRAKCVILWKRHSPVSTIAPMMLKIVIQVPSIVKPLYIHRFDSKTLLLDLQNDFLGHHSRRNPRLK